MASTPLKASVRKGKAIPEPLIGSFLLETITTGMYGERRNAIREYIQNSFDGIQAALEAKVLRPQKGRITVTIDGSNLVVYDNGIGLPHRIAVNTLTAVGASRKQRGHQAGFRGIGRLAGIAFSNSLQFRTKSSDDSVETVVTFDCEALRAGMLHSGRRTAAELISACTTWEQRDADSKDHYFEVSLLDLTNPPAEATDTLQLGLFLSQVAPVDFHPDFASFKTRIVEQSAKFTAPLKGLEEPDASEEISASLAERIPLDHVAIFVRSGDGATEEQIYKPYRRRMAAGKEISVPVSRVSLHYGQSTGAWWGWIGHKANPGDYADPTVAGIRFRLKNIQIDGNELIREVPVTNSAKSTFGRWSNWFVGEIHVDPRVVIPNARRDNFEEDEFWLEIRTEISEICSALTSEARKVSDEFQVSLQTLESRTNKKRTEYLKISRAKTIDPAKVTKFTAETDKILKDIETAGEGASNAAQVQLKSMMKEITKMRVGLLEQPKSSDYEKFRASIRSEFLKKTLSVLNDFLDLKTFEEVKVALEKALQ